jgi:glycosyltransferase involved in cell wall biosynthesis
MFINRAVESVQKQDYSNWEHIIVDGGSTDNTVAILKSYPHVKWVSEKDNGQSDAMNKAFAMATGDIIVYLNADDWFEPGVFSLVIRHFTEDPTIDVVVGNGMFDFVGAQPNKPWNSSASYWKCLMHFKHQFPLNPVSYFYKRQVQEKVGGYNVDNHYTMDYEFILRMFQLFSSKKVESIFGYFYFDGANKSSGRDHFQDLRKTAIRHCKRYHTWGLCVYFYQYYSLMVKKKIYAWRKASR